MTHTPTIVLLGLRGSGKSTLGRALATRLERSFVDLDDRTAAALDAQTPGEALRRHGIERFRLAESDALRGALDQHPGVIALGGGTPTAPGARDELETRRRARSIRTIYLHATPDTLATRLTLPDAPDRPALTGADPAAEVRSLFAERDPVYRALADAVLHTEGVGADAALSMLLAWCA